MQAKYTDVRSRLSGLVGNLLRCSPDVDLPYKNWIIPKNASI